MVAARIYRVPDGQYGQLGLEVPLVRPSVVTTLQTELARVCVDFMAQSFDQLHVTVLQLGRPHELLSEVRQALPLAHSPALPKFLEGLEAFLTKVLVLSAENQFPWHLRSLGLVQLDDATPDRSVPVVLRLRRPPALSAWRQTVWDQLLAFLADQGLDNPRYWAARSPSLRSGRPWVYRPHLLLGHLPPDTKLPYVPVPLPRLELGSLRLRGAYLATGLR